jgi:hypothetical protein
MLGTELITTYELFTIIHSNALVIHFFVMAAGGRRCQAENCKKSAQGGTDYCITHKGGKLCAGKNSDV